MPTTDEDRFKREIEISSRFRKDFKREKKGQHRSSVEADFKAALKLLANDGPLPPHMVDHPLTGEYRGCRDIHLRPDLILIYRKPAKPPPRLQLVRMGSHAELF